MEKIVVPNSYKKLRISLGGFDQRRFNYQFDGLNNQNSRSVINIDDDGIPNLTD